MSSQKDSVELIIDGYVLYDQASARTNAMTLTREFMSQLGVGDNYDLKRIVVEPVGETNYQGRAFVSISCTGAERKRLARLAEKESLYDLLAQLDVKKPEHPLRDRPN